MRHILLTLVLICLPAFAVAESQLERIERLSIAMSEKMYAHIVSLYPAADGNLPDPGWNDSVRDAAACSIGQWGDMIGSEAIDQMMDAMEEHLAKEIDNFETWAAGMELATPLSDEQTLAIEDECGMGQALTEKMMSDPNMPGLMQAMMATMGDG